MDGHLQTIKSIPSFTAQINHSKIAQFKKNVTVFKSSKENT